MLRAKYPSIPALLILGLLFGCSGRSGGLPGPDLPPDCDTFVAKYETCLSTTIPSLPDVARQRAAQTRKALQEEAEHAGTSATSTSLLAALATKCHSNLERLTASCGSTPPSR